MTSPAIARFRHASGLPCWVGRLETVTLDAHTTGVADIETSGLPCWVGRLETIGLALLTNRNLLDLPACLVGWVGLKHALLLHLNLLHGVGTSGLPCWVGRLETSPSCPTSARAGNATSGLPCWVGRLETPSAVSNCFQSMPLASSGLPCWVGRLETMSAPRQISTETLSPLPACLVGWVGLKLFDAPLTKRVAM